MIFEKGKEHLPNASHGAPRADQSAGPLIGFLEQVFSDCQINRSRIGIDVPEESGKVNQPTIRIDSLAIPSKQRSNGKRASEIMETRTGDTWRDVEPQLGDEICES